MKILFLHGWHSVVGGVKPTYLKQAGCTVINPPLDDDHFEIAIREAQQAYDHHHPDVIVGSSRGGAIAMNIDYGTTPLVLLCPAWKKWGAVSTIQANTAILHSRNDDVIPFENSEQLVRNSGLPEETLIEVGYDHRLADEASLSVMLWVCNLLVSGHRLPSYDDLEGRDQASNGNGGGSNTQEEVTYVCDACGEEIVIPVDVSEGLIQTYVEDCPVCCRANTIHVQFNETGAVSAWAAPEQDHR